MYKCCDWLEDNIVFLIITEVADTHILLTCRIELIPNDTPSAKISKTDPALQHKETILLEKAFLSSFVLKDLSSLRQ